MDVTRRCDYACRILRAAYRGEGAYLSVAEISEQENIPYAFARSIQHDLVKGGLIKTVRGAHGGLALACDPQKVTLLDILEVVQGPVSVASCAVEEEYCDKQDACAYNGVWLGADKLLNDYFSQFTLADLLTLGKDHPAVARALDGDAACEAASESGQHKYCGSHGAAAAHA